MRLWPGREASSASSADGGDSGGSGNNDAQANATSVAAGMEESVSTGLAGTPEAWVLDDEVLGEEPSASHVRVEEVATGLLRSSNAKPSVVGYSAVSSVRPTPGRRQVSFAPADGLPSASDASVVSLPSPVAALLASPPDHAIPLSATPLTLDTEEALGGCGHRCNGPCVS